MIKRIIFLRVFRNRREFQSKPKCIHFRLLWLKLCKNQLSLQTKNFQLS
nr:hypothetical protein [Thermodesulfatator indicus]